MYFNYCPFSVFFFVCLLALFACFLFFFCCCWWLVDCLCLFVFGFTTTDTHWKNLPYTAEHKGTLSQPSTHTITLFLLLWTPETAWGEEKHRNRAFWWAVCRFFSTGCVDRQQLHYELLNILRFAIKKSLWDLNKNTITKNQRYPNAISKQAESYITFPYTFYRLEDKSGPIMTLYIQQTNGGCNANTLSLCKLDCWQKWLSNNLLQSNQTPSAVHYS